MDELITAYENYIKWLVKELKETIPFAETHGWKSKRIKEGIEARDAIAKIKKKKQFVESVLDGD